MDVDDAIPLTTKERTSRQMTVLRLANGLMAEYGDEWHEMTIFDIADAAVDVLIADSTLMPSERWDEECHRCEQRIGDHPVDGGCPPVLDEAIRSKAWAAAKPVALAEWQKGSADTTQMLIACSRALDVALEAVLPDRGQRSA